jgi:hypothetical protein
VQKTLYAPSALPMDSLRRPWTTSNATASRQTRAAAAANGRSRLRTPTPPEAAVTEAAAPVSEASPHSWPLDCPNRLETHPEEDRQKDVLLMIRALKIWG